MCAGGDVADHLPDHQHHLAALVREVRGLREVLTAHFQHNGRSRGDPPSDRAASASTLAHSSSGLPRRRSRTRCLVR